MNDKELLGLAKSIGIQDDYFFMQAFDRIFGKPDKPVTIEPVPLIEGPRNDAEVWMMMNGFAPVVHISRDELDEQLKSPGNER